MPEHKYRNIPILIRRYNAKKKLAFGIKVPTIVEY